MITWLIMCIYLYLFVYVYVHLYIYLFIYLFIHVLQTEKHLQKQEEGMWRKTILQTTKSHSPKTVTYLPHRNGFPFFRWARQRDVLLWKWMIGDTLMLVQGVWWLCSGWVPCLGSKGEGPWIFSTVPETNDVSNGGICLYYLVLMMFAQRLYWLKNALMIIPILFYTLQWCQLPKGIGQVLPIWDHWRKVDETRHGETQRLKMPHFQHLP